MATLLIVGCFTAKRPGETVSQRQSDEAGVIICERHVRQTTGLLTNYSAPVAFAFSLENISCVVAYKVVGYNYEVGERRAPAKTQ